MKIFVDSIKMASASSKVNVKISIKIISAELKTVLLAHAQNGTLSWYVLSKIPHTGDTESLDQCR